MKKCPYCAEEIQDEAIVCKHCGREFPKNQIPVQSKSKKSSPWVLVVIFGLIVICAIGITVLMDLPKNENVVSPRELAWSACKDFIGKNLKAPKTAEYQRYTSEQITKTGENEYSVKMYVDAQNSFGAQIRSNFTCNVMTENKKWYLLDLKEK